MHTVWPWVVSFCRNYETFLRSPLHLRYNHLSGVPPLSQALLRDTSPVGPPLSAHRGPQTVPEPDRTNSGVESAEIPPQSPAAPGNILQMRRNETAHRRNRGRWCRGGRRVLERGSAGRPSADSQHLSELRHHAFRRSGPKSCRNLRSSCRRRTSQPKSIAWPQITRACALAIPARALLSPNPPRDPTQLARNCYCLDEPGGAFGSQPVTTAPGGPGRDGPIARRH